MSVTSAIICVVFLLFIGFELVKGRIRFRRGHISRSTSPVIFWLLIALQCAIPVMVIFPKPCLGLIQFGIEDKSAETRTKVQEFQQRKRAETESDGKAAVQSQDRREG